MNAAYAASFAFVSWSTRRHGPEFVRNVLRETRGMRFEAAWRRASGGAPLAAAEGAWRRVSLLRYRWLPILTGSSTLWAAVAGLGALAGALRRRRARLARERWGDVDEAAAEDDGEWAKSPAPEIPAPPEAEEAPRDPPPAGPRT